ncbi:E3 SUMO-protein ligase PIAS2-like isoform X4 [Amphibalanus amphitrite]|uniref:E3 SUMO-protein ligase PIAS2-like isoform X4 n=1 Tax=Amphibalanus amphitrite TaxID=1232801 RepID=UPI001C90FC96|nr:E3 SUMO-protein ligase PIAS2-like isoform X4 [Amphibalanus amphitrite]
MPASRVSRGGPRRRVLSPGEIQPWMRPPPPVWDRPMGDSVLSFPPVNSYVWQRPPPQLSGLHSNHVLPYGYARPADRIRYDSAQRHVPRKPAPTRVSPSTGVSPSTSVSPSTGVSPSSGVSPSTSVSPSTGVSPATVSWSNVPTAVVRPRSQAGLSQPGGGGGAVAGGGAVPDRSSAVYGAHSQPMMQGRGGAGYAPVYMPEYPTKPVSSPVPNSGSKIPTHPDVVFKPLPFFDVIGELLKPTSLAPSYAPGKGYNDGMYGFHLTPQQADDIASNHDGRIGTKLEYPVQIQMRLCLLETSCPQEDHFPPNISVRVNGKTCQLPNPIMSTKPGVEPRRPPKPVNITPLCRISPVQPNTVQISWGVELGRAYCVSICVVRRLSSQDLLNRLRTRGAKNADFTRGLIKEKLCEGYEDEIATTSLKCSLQCPLGKCRMQLPCRATTCQHLQCFDASLYIQMNERKPTWVCPVCDKPALYSSLVIDGYFAEVLKKTSGSCMEVTLHQDGSWREVSKEVKEKPKEEEPSVKVHSLEDDSGSDEVKVTEEKEASPEKKKKEPACVDLTLSDSDDDAPPPPKKRLAAAAAAAGSSSTEVSGNKHSGSSSEASSTATGGSGSLAALRSMSMSPGATVSGAAPYYQSVRQPASAGPLHFDPVGWPYMPTVSSMSAWPSSSSAQPAPQPPPPSSSPDVISLD